jgi:hypothetical protein
MRHNVRVMPGERAISATSAWTRPCGRQRRGSGHGRARDHRGRAADRDRARRFHQPVLAGVAYLKTRSYNPARFIALITRTGGVLAAANLPWFQPVFTDQKLPSRTLMSGIARLPFRSTHGRSRHESRSRGAAVDHPNHRSADLDGSSSRATRADA